MKKLLFVFFLFFGFFASAQKYFTKTGLTEFKASVETFEPVEAKNNSTTAVLNTNNGEVAALLFIKAFHFKVALMEEHFNENYMDSDQYPKATFKGRIIDFNIADLGKAAKDYKLSGILTIRGKSKTIDTDIELKMDNGMVHAQSAFSVEPGDFDIQIPSIVRNKIAESINVSFQYELAEKK